VRRGCLSEICDLCVCQCIGTWRRNLKQRERTAERFTMGRDRASAVSASLNSS
jgi:hypothetical protein